MLRLRQEPDEKAYRKLPIDIVESVGGHDKVLRKPSTERFAEILEIRALQMF